MPADPHGEELPCLNQKCDDGSVNVEGWFPTRRFAFDGMSSGPSVFSVSQFIKSVLQIPKK